MHTQLLKKLGRFFCLGLALFGASYPVAAQLSVGPTGLAPQPFDTLPLASQWSFRSIVGGAGDITTAAQMDAQVQTNAAALINSALLSATGNPPGASASGLWASQGNYILTRVTGNRFTIMMATLRNNSGSNLSSVAISYNLTNRLPVAEQLPGNNVYFSLTGATGSWQKLDALSGVTTLNFVSTNLALGSWAPNSLLYVLFADDNGSGTPDTSVEIDNFAVTLPFPGITNQPQNSSVSPGQSVSLNVGAVGFQPLFYQWRKNSNNIPNATNAILTINNAQASDSGFYQVIVSNAFGQVISSNAFVSVNCAAPATVVTPPADQSLAPGQVINLSVVANGTSPISYQWYRSGTVLPGATGPTYTKVNAQPSDSGLYTVVIDNCAQLPSSASAVVSVTSPPYVLFGLTNHVWKYEQSNTPLYAQGVWHTPNFPDAAWLSGRGVLAFENNAAIIPLTNTVLNNFTPNDYITRYFRTTFVLSNDPATVFLTASNLIDDGMVIYLNGAEAIRYNMPSGPITHATTALAANPAGEGVFIVSNFPSGLAVEGTNTIAVSIHQNGPGSSDSAFGMELRVGFFPSTLLSITDQPDNTVVEETATINLTVGVQGLPAYYQWYKDGAPIVTPNGTDNPFVIPVATTNDAGNYFVVVSNSVNVLTSAVATVTVVTDTNPPTLVVADGTSSNRLVLVSFSELILPSTVTNANFVITNTTVPGTLGITSVVHTNGSNVLITTTTARLTNHNYLLIVNNVRDFSPQTNAIAANSRIPILSKVTVVALNGSWRFYDPFPPADPPDLGTAWKEFTYTETNFWGNGSGVFFSGDPNDVPGPVGTELSQSSAIISYFRRGFNLFASPGGLRFELTHIVDDGAALYLNGPDLFRFNMPSGVLNYQTPPLSTVGNPSRLGPIDLGLPASYRIGSNVLAAELHQSQRFDLDKMFGAQLDAIVESYVNGQIIITRDPVSQTVIEGQSVTFDVEQVGGATFRWQQNNVNIPDGTNAAYTIPIVTTNMDGRQFRVQISNSTPSSALSANATLRVLVDTNRPTIVSAFFVSPTSIRVNFSERLAPASATVPGNYLVTNSAGTVKPVSTATLIDSTNVLLTFASTLSGRHVVVVNNVTDNSSRLNPIAPNSAVEVGVDYLVSMTSAWRYLLINTNEEIQTSYFSPSFDDSGWRGPSNALLYVEGADLPAPKNTPLVLTLANEPGNPRINTFYFRQDWVVPIGGTNILLNLRHIIDDGLVLYLNGEEIYRFTMPGGTVTAATQATAAIGEASLQGPFALTVDLLPGTNVLAAEVHQSGATSSDVVFGLELTGGSPSVVFPPPAPVQIVEQPRSRTNSVGSTAFFRVSATGSGPISYQWFKDGVLLPGATNPLLVVTNVQSGDQTNYVARAVNPFSSATSSLARLTVTGAPPTCAIIPTWTNSLRLVTNGLTAVVSNNTTTIVLSWTNPITNSAPCNNSATVVLQRALTLGNTFPIPNNLWTNIYTNVVGTARVTNSVPGGTQAYYRLRVN